MEGAVDQLDLEVEDREANQHTGVADRVDAFDDARNIFAGDGAADDLRLEFVPFARLLRDNVDLQPRELAGAACLFLMRVVDRVRAREAFAVGDLRGADIGFNLEFALHPVDENVEVKFAHALDDRLARLLVRRNTERGIFRGKALEGEAHLFLVGLGFGLNRQFDDRLRKHHAFKDHRLGGVAQRVTGRGVLQADYRDDITGIGFLDILTVIRMHLNHAADAFLLAFDRIEEARARFKMAGIYAAESQRADERIVHDLERQHRQRLFIRRMADELFFSVRMDALDRGDFIRARQVIDNRIEERLNALVLEGRTAKDRVPGASADRLTDQALQRRHIRLLAVEIFSHAVVVELDTSLNHRRTVFFSFR